MTVNAFVARPLLLATILSIVSCTKPDGIHLSEVYGYAPVTPRGSAVAYLTLRNDSSVSVQIESIKSPDFALVELHESIERNQQIFMQAIRNAVLQPGEQLELRPGGKHLMLMSPDSDILPGTNSRITIRFRDGSNVTALLVLHDRAAPPPGLAQ